MIKFNNKINTGDWETGLFFSSAQILICEVKIIIR